MKSCRGPRRTGNWLLVIFRSSPRLKEVEKKVIELAAMKEEAQKKVVRLEKANSDLMAKVTKIKGEAEQAKAKRKEFFDLAMLVGLEAFENAINQGIALNPGFSLRTADTNVNYVCLAVTWLSL